jgi:hypothetical protein
MILTHWWASLDALGYDAMRLALSALWQSSVLIAAAAGLAWGLRRRRASVRHAGDYGSPNAVPAEKAEMMIARAQRFLDLAERLVGPLPKPAYEQR